MYFRCCVPRRYAPLPLKCHMLRGMVETTRKRTPMSDKHKAALAEGREQGRAVRRYLEALEANKPKRGRKRSPETMKKRLASVESDLATADPLKRLHLVQERMDLEDALQATKASVDLDQLEKEFISAAATYSQRKGISYSAWRQLGVPASVLERASITRGG